MWNSCAGQGDKFTWRQRALILTVGLAHFFRQKRLSMCNSFACLGEIVHIAESRLKPIHNSSNQWTSYFSSEIKQNWCIYQICRPWFNSHGCPKLFDCSDSVLHSDTTSSATPSNTKKKLKPHKLLISVWLVDRYANMWNSQDGDWKLLAVTLTTRLAVMTLGA